MRQIGLKLSDMTMVMVRKGAWDGDTGRAKRRFTEVGRGREREKERCLRGHFDLKRPLYVGLVKEIHEDKC